LAVIAYWKLGHSWESGFGSGWGVGSWALGIDERPILSP
jgi:hypothetical protein